jgi:hypothetical protein
MVLILVVGCGVHEKVNCGGHCPSVWPMNYGEYTTDLSQFILDYPGQVTVGKLCFDPHNNIKFIRISTGFMIKTRYYRDEKVVAEENYRDDAQNECGGLTWDGEQLPRECCQ